MTNDKGIADWMAININDGLDMTLRHNLKGYVEYLSHDVYDSSDFIVTIGYLLNP